ncbi:hypothetical protein NDN08_003133 [Rhodosorus marinus]|uniref:YCII-related domain-containing protein n=1 Tax=Rhodosorus marinus TaxID=101924 RepID=A0AAV8UW01_9RHOD|nr:hypothetical protein NDN08_003133 [Rhodosorus marinus]
MNSAASGGDLLFLAVRHIRPGTQDLRAKTRPEHLNWIIASKRALFAGPMFDKASVPIGSLVIAHAKDMKDLEEWNAQDPYASAGMFDKESFRKWKMVYRPQTPLVDPIYVIICSDRDGAKDLRAEVRPKHLEWWKSSGRNGFIGPFPAADGSGAVGSMIITEGKSEDERRKHSRTSPMAIQAARNGNWVNNRRDQVHYPTELCLSGI